MPENNVRNRRSPDNRSRRRRNGNRRRNADVEIRVDNQVRHLTRTELADSETCAELLELCSTANEVSIQVTTDLLLWSDEQRSRLLNVVQTTNSPLTLPGSTESHDNLLNAVLSIVEGEQDAARFEASRRLAIEAAAIVYPDSLDAACRQIRSRFHDLGVRNLSLKELVTAARNVVGAGQQDALTGPTQVALAFHDALKDELGVSTDASVVRYFREDIYLWNGHAYVLLADAQFEAKVTRWLQENTDSALITRYFVRDVLANLRGIAYVPSWEQDLPLWVEGDTSEPSTFCVFQNGMVDMSQAVDSELELFEFDPCHFDVVVLPLDFDPNAECPLWLESLEQILPRQRDGDRRIAVLQEYLGLCIARGRLNFEKFLIMIGAGSNGKTTILLVFRQLLGEENVSHVPLSEFGSEFRIYSMNNKLANIASEMTFVEKTEEGRLKELTSGDPIQANRKYKSPITMVPTAQLIFATNTLPAINDRSDGVWRRMLVMPFTVQFSEEEKDRDRAPRLMEELPGIFNWGLAGLQRLVANGQFSECDVCQQAVAEHRHDSDPLLQFVDEQCCLGVRERESCAVMYKAYRKFCESSGRKATNNALFGKRVQGLDGIERRRQSQGNREYEYVGIALNQSPSLPTRQPS